MTRAAMLCSGVLALASGCSLVFDIDRSRYRIDGGPGDAGIDAGDAQARDAGGDGAVGGDACVGRVRLERSCDDRSDDDCDGLVDCNDYDCGTRLECCEGGDALFLEEFTSGRIPSTWSWMPSGEGAVTQTMDRIHTFGLSGRPRGILVRPCIPIDLGARITATMTASGTDCPVGAPCGYVALVLTGAADMSPSMPLPDELSVRLYQDGYAEIRQADSVLASSRRDGVQFGSNPIAVTLELSPGITPDGLAYVFATVSMFQDNTEGSVRWPAEGTWQRRPVFPRSYLLDARLGCRDARGLNLAIEGVGHDVTSLDDLGVTRYACANPSHFEVGGGALGIELDAADVGGASGWTSGGLGSPAIQSFYARAVDMTERWDLLYDATNLERTNEGPTRVRFSIGGSFAVGDPDAVTSWRWTARQGGAPLLGCNPPEPPPMGVCNPPTSPLLSYREPSLFVPVDEVEGRRVFVGGGLSGFVAYAREIADAPDRFEIAGTRIETSDFSVADGPMLVAPDTAGCTSVRDPVLVPTRPGSAANLVVLFTCEQDTGISTIRAAQIGEDWGMPVDVVSGDLLTPETLGPYANGGVRAADVAVWFTSTHATYRVWFVTEQLGGPSTISFAEGTSRVGTFPTELLPYPANPVLLGNDPLLGDCPADGCDIESVAVTRIASAPNRVFVLVSRTLEDDPDIRHVLVPLEQVWPAPR